MKYIAVTFLGSAMSFGTFTTMAQDYPVLPVETFGCNYLEGQGLADLDAPFASFNEWADEQAITDLTAVVLAPNFVSEALEFDVFGMDIWDSGAAFGSGVGRMMADENALAEFADVVDCPAHGLFALVGIKPPQGETIDGGLFEFTDCTVRENRTADEGIAAIAAIGEMMNQWNIGDAQGALFPVAGEIPDADYTFKWITYYPSFEAFGRLFDQFAAGAVATAASIIDPVMDCDIGRIYDLHVMREAD